MPAATVSGDMDISRLRNTSIIAHIDHGKSTLADRMLELCGAVDPRDMRAQYLDTMDLERERGITIKLQSVRLDWKDAVINLIDTPGHVDFSYEVSRSLAACEGVILVVDAAQGIEAQTLANCYLALENDLEIVAVLNKIDLPASDCDRVAEQIEDVIGIDASEAIRVSAKTGQGIVETLEAIVHKLPAPKGTQDAPLKAMLVDSWYDSYLGVIVLVRIMDGQLKKGDRIRMMQNGSVHHVDRIGVFRPAMTEIDSLNPGEIGFLTASIKQVRDTRVGDTITHEKKGTETPLPGFKPAQPVVFCGLFPVDAAEFEDLRDSIEKLALNDASFSFEMETSAALGFGFRCGFLGMLHMEIIQERLEREFDMDLVTTTPNVVYQVLLRSGEKVQVDTPAKMPPIGDIEAILEPIVSAEILTPKKYIGSIMTLCQKKRGIYKNTQYLSPEKAQLHYDLPLGEIIFDYYDKLKSISSGYASLDYEFKEFEKASLQKLDILIHSEPVDALSTICHADDAYHRGVALCSKLKELIPRQMFEVAIQAALNNRIIARTTVKALKKNVTAKCYGGDITRKRKLWEKQKKGKKRMKMIGKVEVPQEALLAVLQIDND